MKHREQRIAVVLDLGPLMSIARILDRERMQAELCLHLCERVGVRFAQGNPHEDIRLGYVIADLLDGDVGEFLSVLVGDTTDQHD